MSKRDNTAPAHYRVSSMPIIGNVVDLALWTERDLQRVATALEELRRNVDDLLTREAARDGGGAANKDG